MKNKHLIFYDDRCAFCRKCIVFIIKRDPKMLFAFTSLRGRLAQQVPQLKKKNTLMLVENFQSSRPMGWIRMKAVFRILYLIGGKWKWLGVFCFVPGFLIDPFYWIVASLRKYIKVKGVSLKKDKRFLT